MSPPTVADVLAEQAASRGDEPFLYFEDRVVSYGELDRAVNRMANGLAARGVGPGRGVVIMMGNSPEWLFTYFATQKLGAYAVPINVALKGEGLRYILDHCDAATIVADAELATVVETLAGLEALEQRVSFGDGAPGGWTPLEEVMDASDLDPGATIDPDAISAMLYTSGTTGVPKGVVSRYRSSNIEGIRALGAMLAPDEVLYTCLPLFHANALMLTTMRALVVGRPMVLARRFSASRLWDETRRYQVTTFNALGAMIPILMKQPERPDDTDNPVRVVFSAACPASVWAEFETRFGVHLIEGYAAVDGGGFAVINFGQAPKGSIGAPSQPFRLVDDDGEDVAPGEVGELWFEIDDPEARRVEYYKNPEASASRVVDTWFRTGDLMTADEAGNLYFVDRKSDCLRRRGENISSFEVEREINRHPAVLTSAVFGVPSELGEDEVMAVVVLQPDTALEPEELIEHCREHLAAFMVPRYLEFRTELPTTETHRVQKRVLKEQGVGEHTWDREATSPASGNP
jgi:crotonobetaine/carnitine-CoA ligase